MPRAFALPEPLPLDAQHGQTFVALVALMRRLLADDGCPWDREQTPESLRKYVLEEACEVIDAIDAGDPREVADELGDLALQVVFQAELGRRAGHFGPDDVVRAIVTKLVRRHPHVFAAAFPDAGEPASGGVAGADAGEPASGGVAGADAGEPASGGVAGVDGAEQVLRNWDRIKEGEAAASGRTRGLLDGVPRSLPALQRAQLQSEKVARVGFDWPDPAGSREKVSEELAELDAAVQSGDRGAIEAELGDVLFALVNLGRHHGVDAELALRGTADRFRRRFDHVEARVGAVHGGWPRGADGKPTTGLPLAELDGYWDEAKRAERAGRPA